MDVKTIDIIDFKDGVYEQFIDYAFETIPDNLPFLETEKLLASWLMEKYSATYDRATYTYTFTNQEKYVEFCLTWM